MKKVVLSAITVAFVVLNFSCDLYARETYSFRNKKSFQSQLNSHWRKKVHNESWTWERWQLALWANLYDRPKAALHLLNSISTSHKKVIDSDLYHLNLARTHFQLGDMKSALKQYESISKSSDYWLISLEEKAWAFMHLNSYDKAIATLTTLTTPVFAPVTAAETFFAKGLAHLRICDYKKVFSTTQSFKKHYSQRVTDLSGLANKNQLANSQEALIKLKSGGMTMATVGHLAKSLPRHFWKDRFFQRHFASWKGSKYNPSAKGYKEALKRIKYLAGNELKEISQVIQKMHILEAEAIQRMYVKPLGGDVQTRVKKGQKSQELMYFPSTDEVWLDELDSYQAQVKDCPTLRSAAL